MEFEISIIINRPPPDVFAFFRDKDQHPQAAGSPVHLIQKLSHGSVGTGTRYREVVQMLPLVRGEILSQITEYEPDTLLEEAFTGAGMNGILLYRFYPHGEGTEVVQYETLRPRGLLNLLRPLIRFMFQRAIEARLKQIKQLLESGTPQIEPAY